MKIKANKKNLQTFAYQLIGEDSEESANLLIETCLNGYQEEPGHISHSQAKHLEKIDELLGNHGVEGILEGKIDLLYSNAGDTYKTTIFYMDNELWIGDWGSVVEELGE